MRRPTSTVPDGIPQRGLLAGREFLPSQSNHLLLSRPLISLVYTTSGRHTARAMSALGPTSNRFSFINNGQEKGGKYGQAMSSDCLQQASKQNPAQLQCYQRREGCDRRCARADKAKSCEQIAKSIAGRRVPWHNIPTRTSREGEP
jgi:hypothetical protein